MAVSFVRAHTGSADTASDATVTVTLAANVPAGNLIVVGSSADNSSASDPSQPTVSSLSKPGGESASWVQLAEHDTAATSAAGGVVGELWGIVTTQQWNSGTTITVTWSASIARKVAVCDEYSGASTTARAAYAKNAQTTGTNTLSFSGGLTGDLVIGLASFETSNALTGDSDTTNGSWTTANSQRTASGGAAANVAACMQGKILTGAGAQSYGVTGATGDQGRCVCGLQPAATAVTGTASPAQASDVASGTGSAAITWDNYPGQTVIWGGTSGHPYTTTSTGTGATFNLNDTTTFALGDRSIRITTGGTTQNDFVRVLGGPSMNFTHRVPQIWLKVDDPSRMLDVNLWLGSGGGLGSAYIWSLEDGVPHFYDPDGWVSLTLPWSLATVTGTPNRAALTDLNLQIFDNGNVLNLWWGGLASIPDTTARFPNGVLSFTFDDGYLSTYTEAAPYLNSKGWRGTEFPIDDVIGTGGVYMSSTQLADLRGTFGWEVGLHSHTSADHNAVGGFTSLSAAQIGSNLGAQETFLTGLGLPEPTSYAYPQGAFNGPTAATLRGIADQSRTTKGRPETVPAGDRAKVYCQAADAFVSVSTITNLIDDAVANGEWVVLLFHNLVTSGATGIEYNQADFETIVDYAETAGIAVLPFGEAQNALNTEGSASASQQDQTASASGTSATPGVTGTAAVTQATQAASATGTLGYSGTAAATQADQAAVAAGALGYTGNAAPTQADQTVSSSGSLGYEATGVPTQADQTSAASGVLRYAGTATPVQADQSPTASGTSTVPSFTGTASPAQADDTASASGTIAGPVVGSAASTQQDDLASADGHLGYTATSSVTQEPGTAAATGLTGPSGVGAATQANQTAAGTGVLGVSGAAAASQDDQASTGLGTLIYVAAADLAQAADTAAAAGLAILGGLAAVTQDDDTATAAGVLGGGGAVAAIQDDQVASADGALGSTGTVDAVQADQAAAAFTVIAGIIVEELTGPNVIITTVTGPGARRAASGAALRRQAAGPSTSPAAADGPALTHASASGPESARTVTGTATSRTVTGSET